MLANEREQFYLYSLMRALPLLDPGTKVFATGPRTLRVEREGRPAVDLVYDGAGWLDTLRTRVPDPEGDGMADEEITFTGEIVAGGLRWPRRINVSRNGEPYFDLEIEELSVGSAADLERAAAQK